MKLADKPCYPQTSKVVQRNNAEDIVSVLYTEANDGLTFRERLIIALASNQTFFIDGFIIIDGTGKSNLLRTANTLIAEMEKE